MAEQSDGQAPLRERALERLKKKSEFRAHLLQRAAMWIALGWVVAVSAKLRSLSPA
jgi:hypothetical protein